MESNQLEKDLPDVYNFFSRIGWQFLDFNTMAVPKKRMDWLIEDRLQSYFIPIGKSDDGTVICFCNLDNLDDLEKLPIVYLDVEKQFNQIFTANIFELLSLLPYSVGGIKEIISSWGYFIENSKDTISPSILYKPKELKKKIAYLKKDYNNYDDLVKMLLMLMNIKPHVNPSKLIKENIDKYPNISNWLESK